MDLLNEPIEEHDSTPLPVLYVEDGSVILRFSEIFGIHEPLKKRGKGERRYFTPRGKVVFFLNTLIIWLLFFVQFSIIIIIWLLSLSFVSIMITGFSCYCGSFQRNTIPWIYPNLLKRMRRHI